MDRAPVVVDHEIPLVPVMGIGEGRLREVMHQAVEKPCRLALHPGLHAGEGSVDPVHLFALAQVERLAAADRVDAHHRLGLGPVALVEDLWFAPFAGVVLAVPLEGRDVNADEVFGDGGKLVVQPFPGARSVGIERLALIPGCRFMGIEERDIGWRASEALIGVPAAPVRKTDRKSTVSGTRRIRGSGGSKFIGGRFEMRMIWLDAG